ncbi:MAG: 30S ribosomal protein S6 [Candidatus Omnitrophica bacterium]|nr:30S ribosomal protein S6 [Candidatus Omnitrophota bacterium]MCM8788720.1 30S ribosomal protein S6 [Candidatus Omnitrophota bacterium]
MFRKYEICMVLDPELNQNGVEAETSGISEIMASNGAKVVRRELWGRRGFMYPIKKKNEGYYYLFYLEAEPESVEKIQEQLKHRQTVLRTLVIARKEFPEG